MAFTDRKIDIHLHYGEWNMLVPRTSVGAMGEDLERFHTVLGLVSSALALRADGPAGNEETARVLEEEPRLFGYIYLDPIHPRASREDLERYAASPRFVGVKTRPDHHRTSLLDEGYQELFARAVALDLPLLTHDVETDALARRYPTLRIIAAHSRNASAQRLAGFPNVHFCIASSWASPLEKDVRRMIDAVGVGRILFGSDAPLINPAWTIGTFEGAGLSETELARIYRQNALRVFPRLRPHADPLGA